ncbi:dihydroorotase [Guyparkeria halophila]|uniref:Dihydroorotase n=1 Tax=Guyparkeria halophila TaxID=47960 RepID=A0ABZ0YWH4_9GAMM|nr:dihydroorotase [Guyparkeria halophila]WQH15530.1 dihydroorotase [Guyparkeria halophila]
MDELIIRQPDDWHLHLRDGAMLDAVAGLSARQCARAIIMPNLVPPVTSVAEARAYRDRILAAVGPDRDFQPLMTLYLTDRTTANEIEQAAADPHIHAVKLYPAGATTNSENGVTDPLAIESVLAALERTGLPLCVHGEVVDPAVDIFDREAVFIERVLAPMLERYPNLRVVMEHITTAQAVAFVRSQGERLGATITAHHLMFNRNAMLAGGIRPHYYCLPILKREKHREALLEAAVDPSGKFFMGTDSAPHPKGAKESACGCAGAFTAPVATELYAQVFDQLGALDRLEAFTSLNGPRFYGLPANERRLRLERKVQVVPAPFDCGGDVVVPFLSGETIEWTASLVDD